MTAPIFTPEQELRICQLVREELLFDRGSAVFSRANTDTLRDVRMDALGLSLSLDEAGTVVGVTVAPGGRPIE